MRFVVFCLLLPAVLQSALVAQLVAVAGCQTHRDAAGLRHLHAASVSRHSHVHSHAHHHSHGRSGSRQQPVCNCLQAPADHYDAIYLTELTLQTRRPFEPVVYVSGEVTVTGRSELMPVSTAHSGCSGAHRPAFGGLKHCLLGCSLRL